MTERDWMAEERAELIQGLLPGVMEQWPDADRDMVVAILTATVTQVDMTWQQVLREFAGMVRERAATRPALKPGVEFALLALAPLMEGP